jgi:isopentenyldiphosphate isomerase
MADSNRVDEELLEEWDWETGRPTGVSVQRKRAHREGIPHEGVHLWILRTSKGFPEMLFQHRAGHKEMYPDCLDITVGGHVPFGWQGNKIQKEAREEIGISPGEEDLFDLGYFRYEERTDRLFHREFQRVYLLLDQRELDGYTFTDGEVDGMYAVRLRDLELLLVSDTSFDIEGFEGGPRFRKEASRKDFHPLLFSPSMERYMEVVMTAARELAERGTVSVSMPPP